MFISLPGWKQHPGWGVLQTGREKQKQEGPRHHLWWPEDSRQTWKHQQTSMDGRELSRAWWEIGCVHMG